MKQKILQNKSSINIDIENYEMEFRVHKFIDMINCATNTMHFHNHTHFL